MLDIYKYIYAYIFQFNIWISPDNAKTEFETKNRTWFYFYVANIKSNTTLFFTIKNSNP